MPFFSAAGSMPSQLKVIICLEIHNTHSRNACLPISPTCDLSLASVWPVKLALNLFDLAKLFTLTLGTGQISRTLLPGLSRQSPAVSESCSDTLKVTLTMLTALYTYERLLWDIPEILEAGDDEWPISRKYLESRKQF